MRPNGSKLVHPDSLASSTKLRSGQRCPSVERLGKIRVKVLGAISSQVPLTTQPPFHKVLGKYLARIRVQGKAIRESLEAASGVLNSLAGDVLLIQ